jgi:asparagine synthase (glutamine-hydrolysing)
MCGIGGLILTPPGPVKGEWMRAFLEQLKHRGPDDSGWLSSWKGKLSLGREIRDDIVGDLILLHQRLSILDLSGAGAQPMGTPDRRHWIIFNGEIYNYVELRNELEALGHHFQSRSDTEVLLAAFVEWGPSSLDRLVGMFAFAILDVNARKIFLARDCFGIKPLYYANWQDGFAFASEIPPLLHLPGTDRSVNAARLYEYLRYGITDYGDETLFGHIHQLPPAHYMEVSLDHPWSMQPVRYWQIDLAHKVDLSFNEAANELRNLFLESVRLHLRSDVPVGAALSGGIDSSSIVAVMRLLEPKLEIHTFSYIADDPAISEEHWVDIVGSAARLVVHKVRVTSEELLDDLDHLIGVQGEPFGSTSMYAQWRVFQAAREVGIKVMLDGQGADELLAGYPSYVGARTDSLVRDGRWADAMQLARCGQLSQTWMALLGAIVRMAPAGIQASARRLLKRDAIPSWLNSSWFRAHGVELGPPAHVNGREVLKQALFETLTRNTLPQLLHYEDRNSMASSIESRVPFLIPALVKFVLALPEDYLLPPDGTTKAIFRKAMRDIVPDAILDRKDKKGFPTPEKNWLLSIRPHVERVLKSQMATQIHALNAKEIQSQWEQIMKGSRQLDSRVWRWVNAILWVEKFGVTVE